MENKELLIIIPTYNEGNNILRLLMQLEELGIAVTAAQESEEE